MEVWSTQRNSGQANDNTFSLVGSSSISVGEVLGMKMGVEGSSMYISELRYLILPYRGGINRGGGGDVVSCAYLDS